MKNENLLLPIILLIAILLRFLSLTDYWAHHDIYYFITASRAIYDLILTQHSNIWGAFLYNGQGPLFFILSGFLMTIFGLNYIIGPLINIIFSILTIILLYKLAMLLFDRKIALLSSFFFAILPWQIYLSKTFLVDITASFFFLLSLFFYVKYIKEYEKNKSLYLVLMGLSIGIGSLVKYYLILTAACVYFHYLIFLKFKVPSNKDLSYFRIFKKSLFLFPFFIIGIAMLAMWFIYSDTLRFLFNPFETYSLSPSTQPIISYIPTLFLFDFLCSEFTIFLFIPLIYGIYYCFKNRTQSHLILLVIVIVFIAVNYGLFFLFITRIYDGTPKYFAPLIPFFCILAAIGLLNIGHLILKYAAKIFQNLKGMNLKRLNKIIMALFLISGVIVTSYNISIAEINHSKNLNNTMWIEPAYQILYCYAQASYFIKDNLGISEGGNISALPPDDVALGFNLDWYIPRIPDNISWLIDNFTQNYVIRSSISAYYHFNMTWLEQFDVVFNYTYGEAYIKIYNYTK